MIYSFGYVTILYSGLTKQKILVTDMKIKKLIEQIIKFGIVGVIASVMDIGLLTLLKECLNVEVLLASGISFSVSVVANYLLSMKYVFKGKQQSKLREFVIFVVLSVGGFYINQFIMWFGVKRMNWYYLAVKIFAMIFVPVYNFVTRKIFLEKKDK